MKELGVCQSHMLHFTAATQDKILAEAKELGVPWLRFTIAWADVQPEKGKWNWTKADALVGRCVKAGVRPLAVLCAFPPWSNGGRAMNFWPATNDDWNTYVEAVVSRYSGRVAAWELMNEWNIDGFFFPRDDARYASMAMDAAAAVRTWDASAKVILGGVAGLGADALENVLKLGVANSVDVIAWHPYPESLYGLSCAPIVEYKTGWWLWQKTNRQPDDAVKELRRLIARYCPGKPAWITEYGFSTEGFPYAVPEDMQAAYLTEGLVNWMTYPDVAEVVFYYDMYREYPPSYWWVGRESGFGLLRHGFSRTPAFYAMQAIVAQ